MKKPKKKKSIARPRVLWQLNPFTRVKESARLYSRRKARKPARDPGKDE
jgi:hypothetical protein